MGDENITLNTPNEQGILFYAVTSEEGKGIDYGGNSGSFIGIWYSPRPSSKVQFQGNANTVDGALVGYRVDFSGNSNVLNGNFGGGPASTPTIAIV